MPKKARVKNVPSSTPTFFQRSPIDIANSIAAVLPPVEFHYHSVAIGDLKPSSDGHGFNVHINGDAGKIRAGNVEAKLTQLHFHAKSEHHVDGHEFPLELHLVHEISNPSTESTLMVVGVFFSVESKAKSSVARPSLAQFAKSLLNDKKSKSTDPFNLNHLLPQDSLGYYGYYRYEGSLTTGALDEKVSWIVLRQPVSVIRSDIAPLVSAATHEDLTLQCLNRRFILRNF